MLIDIVVLHFSLREYFGALIRIFLRNDLVIICGALRHIHLYMLYIIL